MKKIMFNDRYGLTQAVLEGRKTMTRRIISYPKKFHGKDVCGFYVCRRKVDGAITELCMYDEEGGSIDEGQILPKYKTGEEVAVAQSYREKQAKHGTLAVAFDIEDIDYVACIQLKCICGHTIHKTDRRHAYDCFDLKSDTWGYDHVTCPKCRRQYEINDNKAKLIKV